MRPKRILGLQRDDPLTHTMANEDLVCDAGPCLPVRHGIAMPDGEEAA
jgi:hypothetical protein